VKIFATLLLIAVLAAGGAAAWIWYALSQPYQGFAPEGVFVTVPHGASNRGVARLLARNGVIRSALAFELYSRRHPKRKPEAGEYFFNAPASGRDVFWKIASGQVFEQPFTVREGETMFDIARELETAKFMSAEEFLKAASDPALVRDIAPQAETLEGFLYPATYNLPRHPIPAQLTAEMVAHFKTEWTRIVQTAKVDGVQAKNHMPVVSIVTLASLVERETPRPEERPLVAGVFENRLNHRMLLQCDPTVIYGLERLGEYRGPLTGSDLRFDSPYNTYVHAGLPPGPIGNPGEASLRAALEPAKTDYLYFVANTQGGHFFSATLAEHNKNVTKYRRLLAGLPADPPPEPPSTKKPKAQSQHKHKKARAAHISR
jgi:UPF0755 protein